MKYTLFKITLLILLVLIGTEILTAMLTEADTIVNLLAIVVFPFFILLGQKIINFKKNTNEKN
jgi:hypothetical protein